MKIDIDENKVINNYIGQMIAERGEDVTSERVDEIWNKLSDEIIDAILGKIGTDELREMGVALGREELTDEKLEEVMGRSGIDFDEVAISVLEKFKKEYMEGER